MHSRKLTNARYITGLDGIRTIAVIGVILYHLLPRIMKGGYLGVPIFFVVSGYLITDLLWQEITANKKIDIIGFYERRMRRLYPVLIVMLIVTSAYITLFDRQFLNNLKGVFVSSITYTNNWWQIAKGSSYFAKFGPESPFSHIWSLAIEGQYYLVWPIVFVILVKLVKDRRKSGIGLFVLSIVSAILMAVLFKAGTDPTRVYYGTDTRLFSILLGSGLAFVLPSYKFKADIPNAEKNKYNLIGLITIGLIILSFFVLNGEMTFVYRGGMYLVSLVSMILVAAVVLPNSFINKCLTNPLFTYIGQRSYGIYLWQFPIMIFFEEKVKGAKERETIFVIIELVVILLVSELSYRYIEKPLKKFNYAKTIRVIMRIFRRPYLSFAKLPYYLTSIVVVIAMVGLIIAPSKALTDEQQRLADKLAENQKKIEENNKKAGTSTVKITDDSGDSGLYGLTNAQVAKAANMKVTAVGDSVLLDVAPDLQEIFPLMEADGAVSRQLWDSYDLMQVLKEQDRLYDTVLILLGTNGKFSQGQFDAFMNIIGEERQVYWVNIYSPEANDIEAAVNELLSENAKTMKNLHVIDWYNLAKDKEEWFYEDRTHPNEKGAGEYTKFVAHGILDVFAEVPKAKEADKTDTKEKADTKDNADTKSKEK